MARGQVIQFSASPPDHHTAILRDELQRTYAKVTSHITVPLHHAYTGTAIVLAGGIATAAAMASSVDFADAGANLGRVVVYGTAPANDATVQVYNVTTGQVLATVVMPGGSPAGTFAGTWTGFTPKGSDENIQVRLVGTGAQTVTLNTVHLQLATGNAAP